MNPIHIPKPYFPKIHHDVVLPSTPRSSFLKTKGNKRDVRKKGKEGKKQKRCE
jgi:hypothetical protein